LFIVPALWSANYLVARLARGVVHPHALAFGRWGLALLLMLPFVAGALWLHRRAMRQEAWHCIVLGGLGMWICGAWVYLGAQSTSATNIALIYSTTPVAIAVVSVKLLHERMRVSQRVAVLFALAGVLFVVAKGQIGDLLAVQWTPGDGWIAACAVSWTAYSVLLKRWPSVLEPLPRLAAITAGGLLVMLPFTLWEWAQQPALPFTSRAALLVAVAAVVPGVLSYAAYSYLQRALGAARTALLLYLAPVYGALGAWLVLGEMPGWYHAVGAALILPSIWLATRPTPNAQPNNPGAREASTPSSA
jgi:drug/metabolite transporter (DMT)-like permease